jgi:ureidoacrylate peracid hydrolase
MRPTPSPKDKDGGKFQLEKWESTHAVDSMMMNYKVIFVSDGTATHSDDEHNAALGNLVSYFADVRSANEVVGCLSKSMNLAAE